MRYQSSKRPRTNPSRLTFLILLVSGLLLFGCGGSPSSQAPDTPQPASDSGSRDLSLTDDQLLIGLWEGSLQTPSGKLIIQFAITPKDDATGLSVTISVPQQQVLQVPASLAVEPDSLTITVDAFKASFSASALTRSTSDGTESLPGTWKQSGQSFPLELTRVSKEVTMQNDTTLLSSPTFARPQQVNPPFPYLVEPMTFTSQFDGAKLSGTVTRPEPASTKERPVPAVVLVTGSGSQNRDEEIFGHRPFALIADRLTRAGIAVLRYDDRGFAQSEGDAATATTRVLLQDAESAVAWLRSQTWCDPEMIGMIGHSEGGLIAMMAAADPAQSLGFIVSLAGPGVPGSEVIVSQSEAIMRAQGYPEAMIATSREANQAIYGIILSKLPLPDRQAAVVKELMKAGVPKANAEGQVSALFSPWFMTFLSLDPRDYLSAIHDIPVLALQGSLDLQVVSSINMAEIEKALERAGNQQVTTMILPGLNHLFQPAQTGLVDEYAVIETTFSEEALTLLTDWIRNVAGL